METSIWSRLRHPHFCCGLKAVAIQANQNISSLDSGLLSQTRSCFLRPSIRSHQSSTCCCVFNGYISLQSTFYRHSGLIAQSTSLAPNLNSTSRQFSSKLTYSRSQLFLLKSKSWIPQHTFSTLKNLGILNTRRNKGGRRHNHQTTRNYINTIELNRPSRSETDKLYCLPGVEIV